MSALDEPLHGRAADKVRHQLREHPAPLPEITGPVREYLAVILDALDIPVPARSTDARARFTAEDRINLVQTSLRGLLAEGDDSNGDVAFDLRWLRKEIKRRPINYEVHPTHGKRDAQ